jgi:hypothetical protein
VEEQIQDGEAKECADVSRRTADFFKRFGYVPPLPDGCIYPRSSDLAAMERRILDAISNREPPKPETQSPFIRRKEAVKLLGCRSTLEKCEKAGWLTATTRRTRLVQYKRQDVLNCAYRLSQGEYP